MKDIVIGCDNAAVLLKNCIIKFLESQGIHVENAGCDDPSDPTHYPLIAERVCEKIMESNFQKQGILLCGTGIGMAITANKFPGILAAVCHDNYSAERSVLSNNCNVLCLGARVIGPQLALTIVREWIGLEFDASSPSGEKVADILKIEAETMH